MKVTNSCIAYKIYDSLGRKILLPGEQKPQRGKEYIL